MPLRISDCAKWAFIFLKVSWVLCACDFGDVRVFRDIIEEALRISL
jgi:hypothetical protein